MTKTLPFPYVKGARGRVTGPFGAINQPNANVREHKGTDHGHGNNTPSDLEIFAPGTGTVIAVGVQGTYGTRIIIDLGHGYTVLLAHLVKDSALVEVGDKVYIGQHIAKMGNSGTVFVHLHQELRYRGVPINGEPFYVALSSLAGYGKIIIETLKKDRKRSVDTLRRVTTGDTYNVAEQTIKHVNQGQSDAASQIQYENDKPLDVTDQQFTNIIDGYMIEPSQVFNYRGSKVPPYHAWSKLHDLDAQMHKILAKLDQK